MVNACLDRLRRHKAYPTAALEDDACHVGDPAPRVETAIVVDFAHMESSGNRSGLVARRAEVGASLAMSIPTFVTRVVRAEQTRYGGLVFKGDDGRVTDESTAEFLANYMAELHGFIARVYTVLPRGTQPPETRTERARH